MWSFKPSMTLLPIAAIAVGLSSNAMLCCDLQPKSNLIGSLQYEPQKGFDISSNSFSGSHSFQMILFVILRLSLHSLTPCHSSFLHRAKFLMLHEQDFRAKIVHLVDDLQDMKEAYRLTSVGNVPVTCTQIPLLALEYEPPKTKSFKTVEASLRVDALASAGFNISRSKLVSLISNGDVRVNWSPVSKNGATLKTGDVVSVSGKGRLKIGEIVTTRKGKFAVELIRYL